MGGMSLLDMADRLDIRLLHMAEKVDLSDTIPFEDIVKEEGFRMEELEKLADSVVIE